MLKGYKSIITGATSGIGLAVAKEFVASGATVIGIGRNFENTKDLGEEFIPFKCDVNNEEEIKDACEFAYKTYNGVLDTLVCNAGAHPDSTVDNIDSNTYDYYSNLLLRAPMLFTKYAHDMLKKSDNPSIIHTSSTSGLLATSDALYGNLKSALITYSRISAANLKGIRVNAVCPGYFRTNIFEGAEWDKIESSDEVKRLIPLHRLGRLEEITKLYRFLASDKARYITGATIPIDGGMYTMIPRSFV